MEFNSFPSTIMHIDLNSCFATIEQQATLFCVVNLSPVAAFTTDRVVFWPHPSKQKSWE